MITINAYCTDCEAEFTFEMSDPSIEQVWAELKNRKCPDCGSCRLGLRFGRRSS